MKVPTMEVFKHRNLVLLVPSITTRDNVTKKDAWYGIGVVFDRRMSFDGRSWNEMYQSSERYTMAREVSLVVESVPRTVAIDNGSVP